MNHLGDITWWNRKCSIKFKTAPKEIFAKLENQLAKLSHSCAIWFVISLVSCQFFNFIGLFHHVVSPTNDVEVNYTKWYVSFHERLIEIVHILP